MFSNLQAPLDDDDKEKEKIYDKKIEELERAIDSPLHVLYLKVEYQSIFVLLCYFLFFFVYNASTSCQSVSLTYIPKTKVKRLLAAFLSSIPILLFINTLL